MLFVVIAIIFGTGDISFAPIIITTMMGTIVLSTFSYDEIAKSDKYILSLPVTRKEIVQSKYVLSILFVALGAIVSIVLTSIVVSIMNIVNPNQIIDIHLEDLFSYGIGGMFGASLIQIIQIPSIYKWGAERGKVQMFIVVMVIIALVSGFIFGIEKLGILTNFKMVEELFHSLENYLLFLIIGILLLLYLASYKISLKIVQRKDY